MLTKLMRQALASVATTLGFRSSNSDGFSIRGVSPLLCSWSPSEHRAGDWRSPLRAGRVCLRSNAHVKDSSFERAPIASVGLPYLFKKKEPGQETCDVEQRYAEASCAYHSVGREKEEREKVHIGDLQAQQNGR